MMCRRWLRYGALLGLAALLLGGCRGFGQQDAAAAPPETILPTETPSPVPTATAAPSPLSLTMPPVTPVPTAEPTPTPSPTPTPVPTPTPTPDGLCGGRFPDKFSDTVVMTEDSYQSPTLAIFLSKVRDENTFTSYVTYFVADIYVQDITLLKTAAAGPDFNARQADHVKRMARNNDAILAASGDYYAHSGQGLIIRNGVSYNDKPTSRFESCVLFRDGTMAFYDSKELDVKALLAAGAWQGWTFGPSLLTEDGQPRTSMPKTYVGVNKQNPRCMLGYYEPGHYCILVVDGRQRSGRYSMGLTLLELSKLAYSLGCTKAYNLDGGQSAQVYWRDGIYNHPTSGGRTISDILYFAAPDAPDK